MKKPSKRTSVPRRLAAVTLAVTVLWVVFATAGSDTLRSALDALSQRSALSVALLAAGGLLAWHGGSFTLLLAGGWVMMAVQKIPVDTCRKKGLPRAVGAGKMSRVKQ